MSNPKDTSGPAFPALGRWGNGHAPESALQQDGMTLRDYFAAKAMHGYCSNEQHCRNCTMEMTAESAYEMADAMLEARNG